MQEENSRQWDFQKQIKVSVNKNFYVKIYKKENLWKKYFSTIECENYFQERKEKLKFFTI